MFARSLQLPANFLVVYVFIGRESAFLRGSPSENRYLVQNSHRTQDYDNEGNPTGLPERVNQSCLSKIVSSFACLRRTLVHASTLFQIDEHTMPIATASTISISHAESHFSTLWARAMTKSFTM